MKHGLKQEIKRGLAILMAASMVAGSSFPVLAEDIVEEQIEVAVEEAAEGATEEATEVIEIEEDTTATEEVVVDGVEETVEEAAESGPSDIAGDKIYDHTHVYDKVVGFDITTKADGYEKNAIITIACSKDNCDAPERSCVIGIDGPTYPFNGWYTTTGEYAYEFGVLASTKGYQIEDCGDHQDYKVTYLLYDLNSPTLTVDVSKEQNYIKSFTFTKPYAHRIPANVGVPKEPTCTQLGQASYNCEVCGEYISAGNIKMLPHAYSLVSYKLNGQDRYVHWSDDAKDAWVVVKCTNGDSKVNGGVHTQEVHLAEFIKEVESGTGALQNPTCLGTGLVTYRLTATKADLEKKLGFRKRADLKDTLLADDYWDTYQGLDLTTKTVRIAKKGHKNLKVKFNWDRTENPSTYYAETGVAATVGCTVSFTCDNPNCELEKFGQWHVENPTKEYLVYKSEDGGRNFTLKQTDPTYGYADAASAVVSEVTSKAKYPTCQKNSGYTYFHCVVEVDGVKYDSSSVGDDKQITLKVDPNASYHSFDIPSNRTEAAAYRTLVKPTCTTPGEGVFECKNPGCNAISTVTKTIPELGHDIKVDTTKFYVAPTCMTTGLYEAQCSRCLKHVTNSSVDVYGIEFDDLTAAQKSAVTAPKEHKFVLAKNGVQWTADNTYCRFAVICDCGSTNGHVSNGPKYGTSYRASYATEVNGDWAKLVKNVKATEVVDVAATGTKEGKKHYVATFKFTDDFGKTWEFKENSASMTIPATGITELALKGKTVVYNGDRQRVDVETNRALKEVVVKYYKDAALTKEFSGEPYTAGTYYVKATVAKNATMTAAESNVVTLVIEKAKPNVTVKASAESAVKKAKKDQKINLTVTQKNKGNQKGKVTFTSNNKNVKVNSKGIVTVKKGTKKCTAKITVKVAATTNYNAITKTISIKVK